MGFLFKKIDSEEKEVDEGIVNFGIFYNFQNFSLDITEIFGERDVLSRCGQNQVF